MKIQQTHVGKRVRAQFNDRRFGTMEVELLELVDRGGTAMVKFMDAYDGIFWEGVIAVNIITVLGPNTIDKLGVPLKLKNNPSKIKK